MWWFSRLHGEEGKPLRPGLTQTHMHASFLTWFSSRSIFMTSPPPFKATLLF